MKTIRLQFVLALAVVLALVLAACGGGDDEQAPTAAPTARATTAPVATVAPTATPIPVPTGQIRFAVSTLLTQDTVPNVTSMRRYLDPMYDYIMGTTVEGKPDTTNGFITAFQVSPDGKSWTLKVRDNVLYHNGDKASSADVKYTVNYYIADPRIAGAGELKALLASMDTPDATTVIANLNSANLFFHINFLAIGNMTGYLQPKTYGEAKGDVEFRKSPVGSGPFKFKENKIGESISYEAQDRHWYYGVPRFKSVQYMVVPEEASRVALLRTRAAEVVEASRNSAPGLKTDNYKLFTKEGAYVAYVNLHQQWQEGNPLGNADVRRAMSLAIDRKTLVDTFLKGLGKPTIDYPVVDWDIAYKEHAVPAFDLTRAKALMAQAGFASGFEIDAYVTPYQALPEGQEIMEAILVAWGQIGIKATRIPTDLPTYLTRWNARTFTKPTVGGVLNIAKRPIATVLAQGTQLKSAVSHIAEDALLQTIIPQYAGALNNDDYIKFGQQVQDRIVDQAIIPALFESGEVYATANDPRFYGWILSKRAYSINANYLAAGK
ncbi:MAG: ABC transporter substrate-binding protein [Dehalococcoidia bacterium]|nr:ABC transporter substrate-binding protein [Dehalococcoidia bacterium]